MGSRLMSLGPVRSVYVSVWRDVRLPTKCFRWPALTVQQKQRHTAACHAARDLVMLGGRPTGWLPHEWRPPAGSATSPRPRAPRWLEQLAGQRLCLSRGGARGLPPHVTRFSRSFATRWRPRYSVDRGADAPPHPRSRRVDVTSALPESSRSTSGSRRACHPASNPNFVASPTGL